MGDARLGGVLWRAEGSSRMATDGMTASMCVHGMRREIAATTTLLKITTPINERAERVGVCVAEGLGLISLLTNAILRTVKSSVWMTMMM